MKRENATSVCVLAGLIFAGVTLRLCLQDLPNFAPVAALSLFCGYFFARRTTALAAPLLVMAISDAVIGGYAWQMMLLVYGSIALPVVLGGPLRRLFSLDRQGARLPAAVGATSGLVACSLGMSLVFFAITNFGVWLWFDMYEPTAAGLARCYVQAPPFFRYTLTGDLIFACVLFGGYALAMLLRRSAEPAVAAERG